MKTRIEPNYLFKVPATLLCWIVLIGMSYLLFFYKDGNLDEANLFETLVIWTFFLMILIGTPLMTYQLIRKQEFLELDAEGITDNTTFATYRVLWSEIDSFQPWQTNKPGSAHVILVNLKNPENFYERSNYKAVGGLLSQYLTEKTPYTINVMGLSKNRKQILETLNQYLTEWRKTSTKHSVPC